jgi:endonuclease/exonuclease/phosphatase (EEP) superfamily protein YafD
LAKRRGVLSKLKRAAVFFFWGGATWLAVLPLLWWVAGERQWFLILCQYAPPVLYFAAWLKLVILAALIRPQRAILGLLPPLLWLLLVLIPFRLHSGGQGDFSALSWNIQAGLSGPEKIAGLLAENKADIIALQEARLPMAQPGGVDPVPVLLQRNKLNVARGGERGELVILSRFTMVSQRLHNLGGLSQALEVRLEINGKIVRVLDVHLMTGDPQGLLKGQPLMSRRRVTLSAETRRLQANSLAAVALSSEEPMILMGDFNSPPSSIAYRTLSTQLKDSFSSAGWGWGLTFPASHPFWRIDYIWCRGLTPVGCQVLQLPASDHRPVLAQIKP